MTKYLPADFLNLYIATHTTLTGRDIARPTKKQIADRISTHTPLAGRDYSGTVMQPQPVPFLLTRPLRDVTLWDEYSEGHHPHFYSHAPCGT